MKHYCNVTFLSVGDTGPDGFPIERLLRCSRCQETYYCGKEQQRQHWKVHKFVCRPAHADIQEEEHIANLGMVAAVQAFHMLCRAIDQHGETISSLIQRYNQLGRRFLFLLKRMHHLDCGEPNIVTSEHDYFACNNVADWMKSLMNVGDRTIELLWAIPGMTTFIFNAELLSVAMSERKLAGAVPSDEELLNPVTNSQPWISSCCSSAAIICSFLEASFTETNDSSESTFFRKSYVAACAARRMMQLYADPYTRAPLPTNEPTDSFLNQRLEQFPRAFASLLTAN